MALKITVSSTFIVCVFEAPFVVERTPGDNVDTLYVNNNVPHALQNPIHTGGSYLYYCQKL